jgi:hypothetical protein
VSEPFRPGARIYFVTSVRGWPGFAAWAAAGALLCLAIVSIASIGLFVMPLAAAAAVAGAMRVRRWPEGLGALAGVALTTLVVGLLNVGNRPCPSSGTLVVPPSRREVSCGGLDSEPFLIIGVVAALLAIGGYVALSKNR